MAQLETAASVEDALNLLSSKQCAVAVVIPAYKVEGQIADVLSSIPSFVTIIVVVDDASPDGTSSIVSRIADLDRRITLVRHEHNQGVGAAMVTGFKTALELGAAVIVKLDGDGQMDPNRISQLVFPLVQADADYAKGNRFFDFEALRQMPIARRAGNLGLGFLAKVAAGYWNCFDPTNGFVAIRSDVLRLLPLEKLDRSFFFEISMLANLYLLGAVVADVPMPARYGQGKSNLSIRRILLQFPPRLLLAFFKRLLLKNFIWGFGMESIYLMAAIPMLIGGISFGAYKWVEYASRGIPAPTGTVMIPTILVLLGFQFLLSAIQLDISSVPAECLCRRLAKLRGQSATIIP